MFDFWSVYSGERFRASWPSCYVMGKALSGELSCMGTGLVVPIFYHNIEVTMGNHMILMIGFTEFRAGIGQNK